MIHLDKEDFNKEISSGNVLVDFYADWCEPCKMMAPVLEELDDKIKIIKVNIDTHEDLASEYRIMSIPTLMFFKDGKNIDEVVGYHSKEDLENIIDKM